jgi:hypothetical protein
MRRRAAACGVLAFAMACGGAAPTSPSDPACTTSWSIEGPRELALGERVLWQAPMTSTCLIGGGWTLPVRWQSSNESVLEVAIVEAACQSGACPRAAVRARGAGVATIVATNPADNIQKSAQVRVLDAPAPAPVRVTFVEPLTAAPATQQFVVEASAEWASGQTRNVTSLSDWSSSDTSVATVSAGTVTPLAAGKATITVNHLGVTTTMPLEVLDASKDGLAPAAVGTTNAKVAYVLTSAPQAQLSIEARASNRTAVAETGRSVNRGLGLETMPLPNVSVFPPDVQIICLTFRLRLPGGPALVADGGCRPR